MAKKRQPKRRLKQNVPLTLQEIKFCHFLFAGEHQGNQLQSYLAAGFPPAAVEVTTRANASKLRTKGNVCAYLEKLEADACAAELLTTRETIRGFRDGANADPYELVTEDFRPLPKSKIPKAHRAAAQGIKVCFKYDTVPDPNDASKTKRVRRIESVEVKLESKTENRKILAQIQRLIGSDAVAPEGQGPKQVVVSGADPNKL